MRCAMGAPGDDQPETLVATSPVANSEQLVQQEELLRYSFSPVECSGNPKSSGINRCDAKPCGLETAVRTSGISESVS